MRNLTLLAAVFCVSSITLPAQNLRIVNAASLSVVSLSPGSIFTVFGTNFTTGVAYAPNAATPPATLGGVTVTIGGAAASLFYVSPTQINGVINPATPVGVQAVVVTSAAGVQNGSVTIAIFAPPGLFSLFGSGTRDGAVLNAVTFLIGAFSTTTAKSPTYLALFATGLNLSIQPTVTIGGVPAPVVFFGAAPCCLGLQQVNVQLPDALAGAGRVPVVLMSAGQTSNTVQVVLLPPAGSKEFDDDEDNQTRSRELAGLAYVPGTSLVLSTDENDDVVRVVDVSARTVTHVIALADHAGPVGIAVNAAGTLAVVAEAGRGKAAVIDLVKFTVLAEISTGAGPVSVAIAGSKAVVVNADADSASIIDLVALTLQKTIPVGRGPTNVAIDAALNAYVVNEDDGSISVISLATAAVTRTIVLGAAIRPEAIALIPTAGVAFLTVPADGPDGTTLLVNLATGVITSTMKANPDRSGGSSDAVYFNSKVYFANQTGGSISVLPVNPATGAATGPAASIKVDLGVRALAIDTKDNFLVASNQGTGTLVVIRLDTNAVVGRIKAVKSGDDDKDDHADHDSAPNLPAVRSIDPDSGKAGSTFALTLTGVNFTGATAVTFERPGNGGDEHDFTVTNLQVSAGGTRISATVAIAASARPGARFVRVTAVNGTSSAKPGEDGTFTVKP